MSGSAVVERIAKVTHFLKHRAINHLNFIKTSCKGRIEGVAWRYTRFSDFFEEKPKMG